MQNASFGDESEKNIKHVTKYPKDIELKIKHSYGILFV